MAQHHKYSIAEIEDMMPYERDIYIDMLLAFLEKQKQEMEKYVLVVLNCFYDQEILTFDFTFYIDMQFSY